MIVAQLVSLFTRASIPIRGVSIGDLDDRTTWKVDYTGATDQQKTAGEALLASYDPKQDTAFLEEQAEKAAPAYLDKPEAQALLVVLSEFFDVQVADVHERLKSAYKSAYTLPC